ncbi:hypothetical protein WN48_05056 [Eufriesea mexicana]|nr:hypothetical protein WN48_05056 [Eufriesea mexicana]
MVWDDGLSVKELTEMRKKTPRFPSRERNFAMRRRGIQRNFPLGLASASPLPGPPPPDVQEECVRCTYDRSCDHDVCTLYTPTYVLVESHGASLKYAPSANALCYAARAAPCDFESPAFPPPPSRLPIFRLIAVVPIFPPSFPLAAEPAESVLAGRQCKTISPTISPTISRSTEATSDGAVGESRRSWYDEDRRWRTKRFILNDKLQRRHTTPTLLSSSGPRMSPKGPSQEGQKMEVRVSCVPTPGAEPQGIRVKIPEPAKRPTSPPFHDPMRARCPSVPEKDLYRKTASLDRRDRYPTLSGAEIKRGLIPGGYRKNRFPTISGAELKRSLAIGKCPLKDGLDLSLARWPGMKWACVRVLHLYCKVFDQFELFELIVRKNCTSCKCPREAHNVCHAEWVSVKSRLGLKGEESSWPVAFDPREKGLAWAPPGLPAHKVEEYFSMLPVISVPRLGTHGERYRDRQLAIQLPKQDLSVAYCRHLDSEHWSSADDFMAARNEIALDIGSVQEVAERDLNCGACHTPLKYGSLAVSATKLGLLYHPACFRCTECKELLVDLAYCVRDDTLYCERHYAEQLKPRCAACDETSENPFAVRARGLPVYVSEGTVAVNHPGAVPPMLTKSDELAEKDDRMKHGQRYGCPTCRRVEFVTQRRLGSE